MTETTKEIDTDMCICVIVEFGLILKFKIQSLYTKIYGNDTV